MYAFSFWIVWCMYARHPLSGQSFGGGAPPPSIASLLFAYLLAT